MRKNLLKTWLTLVCLLFVTGTSWAEALGTGYTKITNIKSLSAGDVVVLYCDDSNSGVTGYSGSDATVSTNASDWIQFIVEKGGSLFYLKNPADNQYITKQTSNKFTISDTTQSGNEVTVDKNGVLSLSGRYLVKNGNYYRMYTSVDGYKGVFVYKVTSDGGTTPTNYSVTIANDITNGTVTASSTSAVEGTEITLTATPSSGYKFVSWNVTNASTSAPITVSNNKFTMPAANVYVNATFNSVSSDGYTHDVLTNADFNATNSNYSRSSGVRKNRAVYDGYTAKNNGIQLKNSSPSGIVSTTSGGKIKQVIVTWNAYCASGRTLDVYGKNTAYTDASNLYDGNNWGTKLGSIVKGTSTVFTITDDYAYVGVRSNGELNIDNIEFVWDEGSNASEDPDNTATISIASACTDGEKCYSTYSNASSWIVPAELTVSEIGVDGGALSVVSYKTGDVVPANTGVMVSAAEGGNYTVTLTTNAGAHPADVTNALRSSGNGISAAAMAETDADCKFYRLTMHDGTKIGFWWGAAEGAAFSLAANKAYLAVPNTAVKAQGLWANAGETAINTVEAAAPKAAYDLQGRKVNAAQKGLYIINGKKVVLK